MLPPSKNAGVAVPHLPTEVIKRDGSRKRFDAGKIESAIARAGAATGEVGAHAATALTTQVIKVIAHRYPGKAPAIEDIQDIVEQALKIGRAHV